MLSVDLMSREVTGSLLPHLLPDAEGWDDFSRVEVGERVERALVERVEKRSALLRRLPEESEEEEARPLFLSIPVRFSVVETFFSRLNSLLFSGQTHVRQRKRFLP